MPGEERIRVRVRYLFALRDRDRDRNAVVELVAGATVFDALRRLGLSGIEILAAVNGEATGDSVVLRDGDELTLIPAIQGG